MKKYLPFIIAGLLLLVIIVSLIQTPAPDKKEIKKENAAADKTIATEQKKRESWRQDSIKLARRADSLAAFIANQKAKDKDFTKKENEVRNLPVYTTDNEYNDFFTKRYSKKGLVR